MTTLEILYAARQSIANPRTKWDFSDWTSCTCGHIYRAANGGRKASTPGQVTHTTKQKVLDAFNEVSRVLELPVRSLPSGERMFDIAISDATSDRAPENANDVTREHALSLIDDAIAALEAEYERNRLDVLAQTKRIVDNADLPEPVTA